MSDGGETRGYVLFDQVHLPILMIPIGPFYIGWVLAAQRLLPTVWGFYVALLSILPFLGVGTLLINDAYDAPVDGLSSRKGTYASSTGRFSQGNLRTYALVAFAVSLALAFAVSVRFGSVVAVLVALALVYSMPPAQLSRRPGWDLAMNSIGIGVVCTIAGWVLASEESLPPLAWLVTSALGTGTFFFLPTLMDHESDLEGGKRSIVVSLGWRRSCLLGLLLISLADVGIVYMSLSSIILKPAFLWVAVPIIAGELAVFPVLAYRPGLLKHLTAVMGGLLFVGNLSIVLSYLGHLGPF
jgi:4-hydroxybenzoate polyprenyltransferase